MMVLGACLLVVLHDNGDIYLGTYLSSRGKAGWLEGWALWCPHTRPHSRVQSPVGVVSDLSFQFYHDRQIVNAVFSMEKWQDSRPWFQQFIGHAYCFPPRK
jgi:hypothetical protein